MPCYSYIDTDGKQLVVADDTQNRIEFGTGGSELIITQNSKEGSSTRVLGSREFLRYYRQKPRPMPANDIALSAALASRFGSYPFLALCHELTPFSLHPENECVKSIIL